MRSRPLTGMALAAVILTSATPLSLPASALSVAPPVPSPVRCNPRAIDDAARPMPRTGKVFAPRQPMIAPPPPPPAPPPPPTASQGTQEMVVTGTRVQSPPLNAAAPIVTTAARRLPPPDTARYEGHAVAAIQSVAETPVSTFSVDVDTGSYSNVRRFLNQGQVPPTAAVRTEEMINYFRYDYPAPKSRETPFTITTDVARTPWNAETRLMRIGLRGYDTTSAERPPANLVFLVDVSGSMSPPERLPLVKSALMMLADKLTPRDRVSIVVYAGAAGIVLEPTHDKNYVKQALDCLQAGGSTAGGAGLSLAYATARASYIKGGINRILIATDGDFNVGVTNNETLEDMVKREREHGITLTTLGFGDNNYNEALMESIADVGNGNYAYIDSATEAQKVLDEELSSTLFTIARDVKIQVEFNPAWVSEYRLIGYENRLLAEDDFDNDRVDAGDIGAGHQVTAIYEVVPAGAKGWLPERRYEMNQRLPGAGPASELAYVKLRYKLPDGATSRLIERTVPARAIAAAQRPHGDMAFAVAVAGFGQKLRGDKYLNGFGYVDVQRLAGVQQNFWRQEFVKLASLAGSRDTGGGGGR